ncbi:MAG: multidrug effflux MFS transporter [Fluviicoccus sp.]|uniref:multidrug effflux MFS transporter n=1 Tax=Fluviicoccus sp. TaxID=2003552 RepID=UPI0027256817|nr:multidrug effflux MFS transporter [Fluviicoccus sp.]MDO8331222.1 multidrug effflux MFS transporter [Fluviicoccus sp.]
MPTPRPSSSWLLLLGAIVALGPLAIDMYLPAFPAIEQQFGPGAQLTLSGFFIGLVLGQLFYGPISDRIGRRKPLLFGLAVYTLTSFACIFAGSLIELTALRFLQALGACAGMVLSRAVVRDRCDAKSAAQAQSKLILVMGLAPILAPSLGGLLLEVADWHAIFAVQAAAGLLFLLWAWRSLTESHGEAHRSEKLSVMQVLKTFGALLKERRFMGYTLSSGLAFTGMFAYIAGSPQVLITLKGLSPGHYGIAFGLNAAGFIAASQINARLLRRVDMNFLLQRAIWLPGLVTLSLLGLELSGMLNLPLLLLGFFLYLASLGFISPNAGAAALATQPQHRVGAASSLMGSLQFLMATLVSAWLALWQRPDALPLMVVMGVCGCGAFIWHRLLLHPARSR